MTTADQEAPALQSPVAPAGGGEGESSVTVLLALAANIGVGLLKLAAGLITGSAALLSEAAHSAGDCTTEVFLLAGQNLPPNSAGASGYYQILPSTWKLFGGTGSAAYQAPKGEQDAVAGRIWNGGAGASNWVCAGIVGIH